MRVEDRREDHAEDQHGRGVTFPALVFGTAPAEQAEEGALHRIVALGRVDPGHVAAERVGERDQHRRVEHYLADAFGGHQNRSPRKSANTR